MTDRSANANGVGARRFRNLAAVVLVSSTLLASDAFGQQVILAGSDLWSTPGGGHSTHSFADAPIPAGFFGPGSEAFDGTVTFQGLPLNDNPGLAPMDVFDFGLNDTIVQRTDDMSLQQTGDMATTPIQIIALSLVSVERITIMINGQETLFLVEAQLPTGVQ
ncbi:MAG: hypothetical protein IH987_07225 [Planctomycetes bacterium]|nr:hypothetical protein [Planctomycetota bacterium]